MLAIVLFVVALAADILIRMYRKRGKSKSVASVLVEATRTEEPEQVKMSKQEVAEQEQN